MNTPEAYTDVPAAVLWDNRTWSEAEFARRTHPSSGLPPVVTRFFPLLPTPCRPCGGDDPTLYTDGKGIR